MKKSRVLLSLLLLCISVGSVAVASDSAEDAIRAVVEEAYVRGIHIDRDPDAIRSGFHESFVMLVRADEGVSKVTRDEWIANIEKSNATVPDRPKTKIDHRFKLVDVTGRAAVVKIEIDRDGTHVFTDYMSLYRTDDGWKIVGKIFFRHP